MNYENGECVKTIFELQWSEKPKFIIHKPNGNENIAVKKQKIYNCVQENIIE